MPELSACAAELKFPAACEIAAESAEFAPFLSRSAPVLASVAPDVTVLCALDAHAGGGAPLIAPARALMFWDAAIAFGFQVASWRFGAFACPARTAPARSGRRVAACTAPRMCPRASMSRPAVAWRRRAVVAVAIGTAVRVAVAAVCGVLRRRLCREAWSQRAGRSCVAGDGRATSGCRCRGQRPNGRRIVVATAHAERDISDSEDSCRDGNTDNEATKFSHEMFLLGAGHWGESNCPMEACQTMRHRAEITRRAQ